METEPGLQARLDHREIQQSVKVARGKEPVATHFEKRSHAMGAVEAIEVGAVDDGQNGAIDGLKCLRGLPGIQGLDPYIQSQM